MVDLFRSNTNHQTSRFFSQFLMPGMEGVDALQSSWPPGLLYAFPPLAIISKVFHKLLAKGAELILTAPHWPHHPLFVDLVALLVASHCRLPRDPRALNQDSLLHPDANWLQLTTAWRLSGRS